MDDIEQASDAVTRETERGIKAARAAAENTPQGRPGVCDDCALYVQRIVGGRCAHCRDMIGGGR